MLLTKVILVQVSKNHLEEKNKEVVIEVIYCYKVKIEKIRYKNLFLEKNL